MSTAGQLSSQNLLSGAITGPGRKPDIPQTDTGPASSNPAGSNPVNTVLSANTASQASANPSSALLSLIPSLMTVMSTMTQTMNTLAGAIGSITQASQGAVPDVDPNAFVVQGGPGVGLVVQPFNPGAMFTATPPVVQPFDPNALFATTQTTGQPQTPVSQPQAPASGMPASPAVDPNLLFLNGQPILDPLDPNTLRPVSAQPAVPAFNPVTLVPAAPAGTISAPQGSAPQGLVPQGAGAPPGGASALPREIPGGPAGQPGPPSGSAGSGPDSLAVDPLTGQAPTNPVIINQETPTVARRIDPTLDFPKLGNDQKSSLGLSDTDRAILHLWGRQMVIVGHQNGAILNTVLDDAAHGGVDPTGSVLVNPTEVAVAQQLAAQDMAKDGGVTGRSLDDAFFQVFQKITGADISQRYADRPIFFANGQEARFPPGSVDTPQWEQQLEAGSGLNGFENTIFREWGHDPLFNGGKIDGSVLAYTMESPSALDVGINKNDIATLMKADLASENGVIDGRSLKNGFLDVMDRVYGLRSTAVTPDEIMNNAVQTAVNNGQTADQINQNITVGFNQALGIAADMVKNHPIITGMGAVSLAAASAVCPFLAGLGAGAAGIALGQKMLNQTSSPEASAAPPINGIAASPLPAANQPQQPKA